MRDERLRELDRRRRSSGDPADDEAWLQECVRSGEYERRLKALGDRLGEPGYDSHGVFRVLRLDDAWKSRTPLEQLGLATEAAGFSRLEGLRRLDRAEARLLIEKNCRHTLAYEDELCSEEEARSIGAELLELIPAHAPLFTNLGEGWTQGGGIRTDNLTGATFDEGVVAWTGEFVIVVWFQDED